MKTWLKRILKWTGEGLIGLFILGFIIDFSTGVFESKSTNVNTPASINAPLTQDPTLVADAQQLGIDYSPLNLSFTSQPITSNTETTDGSPIGVFFAPNTIHIQSGLAKSDELNILAYEYMHYAWANLTSTQRSTIGAELDAFRTQDADFNSDVSRYHGDTAVIQNEEDSTACTRVDPSLLSDSFNAYCNQFIANRSILFQ